MFSSYNHNSVGRVTRSSTGIIYFLPNFLKNVAQINLFSFSFLVQFCQILWKISGFFRLFSARKNVVFVSEIGFNQCTFWAKNVLKAPTCFKNKNDNKITKWSNKNMRVEEWDSKYFWCQIKIQTSFCLLFSKSKNIVLFLF